MGRVALDAAGSGGDFTLRIYLHSLGDDPSPDREHHHFSERER